MTPSYARRQRSDLVMCMILEKLCSVQLQVTNPQGLKEGEEQVEPPQLRKLE